MRVSINNIEAVDSCLHRNDYIIWRLRQRFVTKIKSKTEKIRSYHNRFGVGPRAKKVAAKHFFADGKDISNHSILLGFLSFFWRILILVQYIIQNRKIDIWRCRKISCLFPALVMIVFWGLVIRLWVFDGFKLPLVFIGIWIIGLFYFKSIEGYQYIFMGYGAVLALAMIIIQACKGYYWTSVNGILIVIAKLRSFPDFVAEATSAE